MELAYSYSNKQAIEDGIFADVTPQSMKGKWTWIVTAAIHEEFSLAAIAEFFNTTAEAYNKNPNVEFPVVTKMNGKDVWCFLEQEDGIGKIFKAIFPSEY